MGTRAAAVNGRLPPRPSRRPALLDGQPVALWQPVRLDGRVVDLRLWPGTPAPGTLLSELLPETVIDGRLLALCLVAQTGQPFRMTLPATSRRSTEAELVGRRRPDGAVSVAVRYLPEQERRRRDLARGDRRWRRMFDDAPLGIAVLTLDGHLLEANTALASMLRRSRAELAGMRLHDLALPGDLTRVDRERLLRTGRNTMEKGYLRGDGTPVWLRSATSLLFEEGERRLLTICTDATESRRAEADVRWRALHDPLTGLLNRNGLDGHLAGVIRQMATGSPAGVTLLLLDLDQFKVVNDSLGHAAGDALLREVAQRLQRVVPAGGVVGRLGGDEFVVVQPGCEGRELADLVHAALAPPVRVQGRAVTISASIGIADRAANAAVRAQAEGALPVAEALLRDADTAMFVAKRAGPGRVRLFDDDLRRRAVARLDDEQDLRRALAEGELRVHYQPVFALPVGHRVALEALVRWQHPRRGLLLPEAFLEVAEQTGLLGDIGRYVLRSACRQLARLRHNEPALTVAVNIAAQHLATGTLRADVRAALGPSGLPADALTLEITEGTLVDCKDDTTGALAELRAAGCRVALDDFGTGFSSLAYLRQLPVDILKIDRSFVAGVGTPDNDGALLSAIAALARSLHLETVAEGIETPAELAAVTAAGATHGQGFLLGRPAAASSRPAGGPNSGSGN